MRNRARYHAQSSTQEPDTTVQSMLIANASATNDCSAKKHSTDAETGGQDPQSRPHAAAHDLPQNITLQLHSATKYTTFEAKTHRKKTSIGCKRCFMATKSALSRRSVHRYGSNLADLHSCICNMCCKRKKKRSASQSGERAAHLPSATAISETAVTCKHGQKIHGGAPP